MTHSDDDGLVLPPKIAPKITQSFGETLSSHHVIHDDKQAYTEEFEPICFTSTSFSDVRKIVNKFDLNGNTRTIVSGTTPIRRPVNTNKPTTTTTTTNSSSTNKIESFVKTVIASPKLVYENNDASPSPVLFNEDDLSSSSDQIVSYLNVDKEKKDNDTDSYDDEDEDVNRINLNMLADANMFKSTLLSRLTVKNSSNSVNGEVEKLLNELIEKIVMQNEAGCRSGDDDDFGVWEKN